MTRMMERLANMSCDIPPLAAFCDRDTAKHGMYLKGILIVSPERLLELCMAHQVGHIVIGVDGKPAEEIRQEVKSRFPSNVKLVEFDEFFSPLKLEHIANIRKERVFRWDVAFETQLEKWIQNFMGEVRFWSQHVANPAGYARQHYLDMLNTRDFDGVYKTTPIAHLVKDQAIVMDFGCGVVSRFGENLPGSGKIHLIPVDPLAPFYNRINERFSGGRIGNRCCQLGLFEFAAHFFEKNYSDLIIIHNALDHCIDPYKSILECLYVLKPGGRMHLDHRMNEAEFEDYIGLHQWNIDCDGAGNFVIWNEENAINVSEALKDIADMKISFADDAYGWKFMIAEITKLRDFNLDEFIGMEQECRELALFVQKLMGWIAGENTDYLCCEN